MRKVLFLAVALLAACGGSDEADGLASTYGRDIPEDQGEAVEQLSEALPPLVSVPFAEYGTGHVDPPVQFDTSPSKGGDHYQFWQNCGFYTVEAIEGAATHTLEHGAVWITYNASEMTNKDLGLLESLAGSQKLLVSPYDHEDAIVLTAWGVQQTGVAAPSSPDGAAQIDAFIAAWVDNPELAEAGVRCDGAVGLPPEDVRSFQDGAQVPEEFN